VRVRPSSAKSYVVIYRAGAGRGAPVRRYTIAAVGKRKAGTAEFYQDILDRIVKPAVGTTKADKLTRHQIGRLHSSLSETPFQAKR
jgi:hypothetical protein